MLINRRNLLKSAIALPWLNTELLASDSNLDSLGMMIASCSNHFDQHYVAMVRLETLEYKLTPIKQRGHALAINPEQISHAVLASRRPGNILSLLDVDHGEILTQVSCRSNRHLYGHCSFSKNGKLVLTTENDYEKDAGIISIRDGQTLKLIDEIPSFGIGPHDLAFMPDEKTIVVANGGILTHPDTGRRKLNLNQMKPSLAYIDIKYAKLIDQYYLPDPKLSIRHIDVNTLGEVGIATQDQAEYESSANQTSLIALHSNKNYQPELIKLPTQTTRALNRYTADFCFDSHSKTALVSSPRGNCVLVINTNNQELIDRLPISQPSAIALTRDQQYFVVSTAKGGIHFIDVKTSKLMSGMTKHLPNIQWDNHMSIL